MSAKLAVIMASMAIIGAITVPTTVFAQEGESQNADGDIKRNYEIEQSVEQEQKACAIGASAEIGDDDFVGIAGNNRASLSQENICLANQSQDASNSAVIADSSDNTVNVDTSLVPFCRNLPPDLVIPSFCLPSRGEIAIITESLPSFY